MTPAPSFSALTATQRMAICNGCGAKGGPFDPPDFLFSASCDRHDYSYWIGHTEPDRIRADYGFYLAMVRDANAAGWYGRWFFRIMAWVYYRAVRRWGAPYFHYADRPRTAEDLRRIVQEAEG